MRKLLVLLYSNVDAGIFTTSRPCRDEQRRDGICQVASPSSNISVLVDGKEIKSGENFCKQRRNAGLCGGEWGGGELTPL